MTTFYKIHMSGGIGRALCRKPNRRSVSLSRRGGPLLMTTKADEVTCKRCRELYEALRANAENPPVNKLGHRTN